MKRKTSERLHFDDELSVDWALLNAYKRIEAHEIKWNIILETRKEQENEKQEEKKIVLRQFQFEIDRTPIFHLFSIGKFSSFKTV